MKTMAWRFLPALAALTIFLSSGQSSPRREAFTIEFYGNKTRVLSPKRHHPRSHLIVENQTLSSLVGRIEGVVGEVRKHISVGPNSTLSVSLGMKRGERLFFVPLSPPLESYELKVGNPFYEIPPSR